AAVRGSRRYQTRRGARHGPPHHPPRRVAPQGRDGRAGDGRDPRKGRRSQGVKRPMWTRKAARAFAISSVAAAIGLAVGSGMLVALAGILLLAPLVALLLDR